jgi:hypothetical protein
MAKLRPDKTTEFKQQIIDSCRKKSNSFMKFSEYSLETFMKTVIYGLVCVLLFSCAASQENYSILSERGSDDLVKAQDGETALLGFQERLHRDIQDFYLTVKGEYSLSEGQLNAMGSFMDGALVSSPVEFFERKVHSKYQDPETSRIDYDYVRDRFIGVTVGKRILIFVKGENLKYKIFDSIPITVLAGASLEAKIKFYLDAKYYERDRIKNRFSTINSVEFVANILPGYRGARNAFYGSGNERLLGVVQIVGDAATLGLGSKIQVVRKGAAAIVITAASIRVGKSAADFVSGNGSTASGIDAVLATLEASLAAVTIVKLKIRPSRAMVSSMDEANVLSRQLNRRADDIMKNGISPEEFKRLTGRVLRSGDEISDIGRGLRKADDLTLPRMCRTGFGLVAGNCLADELDQAIANLTPQYRVPIIYEYVEKIVVKWGLKNESRLTKINKRKVYSLGFGKKKTYYAVDRQHGHLEVCNRKGKHQGSVNVDGKEVPGKLDSSGGHDLIVK